MPPVSNMIGTQSGKAWSDQRKRGNNLKPQSPGEAGRPGEDRIHLPGGTQQRYILLLHPINQLGKFRNLVKLERGQSLHVKSAAPGQTGRA